MVLSFFVEIGGVELAGLLSPVTIGEDDGIHGGDLPSGAVIPPSMNDARPAENKVGIPVSVIAKSDIMNARDHVENTTTTHAEML